MDRPDLADPISDNGFEGRFAPPPPTGNLPVPMGQDTNIQTFGSIITAQRVAKPRQTQYILAELKQLCAANGDAYVYSWEVKDRKNGRTTTIEGPTIKLANDVARLYGNCVVDVRVFDDGGTHLVFYARFTDLESGYSLTRPFRQRKGQDTGMRDAERQADIVFQIGASKAIRNVIVNALSTFIDFSIEEAKVKLVEKFSKKENAERAQDFIKLTMEMHGLTFRRVEAVIGRTKEAWTVRDLARVYTSMRAIREGMAVADEQYPPEDVAEKVANKKAEAKADTTERFRDPETEPETKPEPKSETHDPETGEVSEKKVEPETKPAPAKATTKPKAEAKKTVNAFGDE